MNNGRTRHTNENIDTVMDVLRRMQAALSEIKDGSEMTVAFGKQNLNWRNMRRMMDLLPNCILNQDENENILDADLTLVPNPYEKLYLNIFGVEEKDFASVMLPADYKETLIHVMNEKLTAGMKSVLYMRYGLAEKSVPMTLGEIGKKFGKSAERIRSLEAQAMRKLRYSSSIKILKKGLAQHKSDAEMEQKVEQAKKEQREKDCKAMLDLLKQKQESDIPSSVVLNAENQKTSENPIKAACRNILISELGLSARPCNALSRARINTLDELVEVRLANRLGKVRNLGKASIEEINEKLEAKIQNLFEMRIGEFLSLYTEIDAPQ